MTTATTIGRACLLAILAWWTARFVPHPLDADRIVDSFLHLINLPFHEAGHIVFSPLGEFMTVLGGSLFQVIIPVVCAAAFIRREDWFAVTVCLWWEAILETLGWLSLDHTLGMAAHITGSVVMIGALAGGVWCLRSQWSPEGAEA